MPVLINEHTIRRITHILQMRGQIGKDLKAGGDHYESMIHAFLNKTSGEYRFIGTLGFGGKLFFSFSKGFWVSCYQEDETPEVLEKIAEINKTLDILVNKPL